MDSAEQRRLEALLALDILDTAPSESFDRITRMASQLFQLPIAAVSLTDQDRQWFKSRVGVDHLQIPRWKAPCAEVAETSDVLVVPDLLADSCYMSSPLAQSGVRFYAGAPLVTRDGFGLGAMCVLGTEPREATEAELKALKDLAAMVMAQIELQHAFGRVDPLSGLPNRNQFIEDVEDLSRDYPGERRLAILVDLVEVGKLAEGLRVIGQSYVDDIVAGSTRTLRAALPAGTKLYQIGTTHQAFLLPDMDRVRLDAETERFGMLLETVAGSNGVPLATSAVIGVVPFRLGEVAPRDVLRTAFSAAQDARNGELGVGVYSSNLDETHKRRFRLLADLPGALTRSGELTLFYQPRIDVRTGACVSAEALLRWRHPSLGEIPPGEFIPLVEHTALIHDVTAWVIGTALGQVAEWRRRGLNIPISVNVSAANLDDNGFAADLVGQLHKHRLPGTAIEVELTESAIIGNGRRALDQIRRLSRAGIRIAIDDFGTGYSSLSYLQQIPADTVKIDRSFITDLGAEIPSTRERAETLVSAMISMAHDLGYSVVAEGVETEAMFRFLARHGCEEAQGYLFSRPLPAHKFEDWLRDRTGRESEPAAARLSA